MYILQHDTSSFLNCCLLGQLSGIGYWVGYKLFKRNSYAKIPFWYPYVLFKLYRLIIFQIFAFVIIFFTEFAIIRIITCDSAGGGWLLRLSLFCYYYYHYNITMLTGKRISTTPIFSDNPTIEVPTDIPLHLTSAKFPLTDSCTIYVVETRSNNTTATPGFFNHPHHRPHRCLMCHPP